MKEGRKGCRKIENGERGTERERKNYEGSDTEK